MEEAVKSGPIQEVVGEGTDIDDHDKTSEDATSLNLEDSPGQPLDEHLETRKATEKSLPVENHVSESHEGNTESVLSRSSTPSEGTTPRDGDTSSGSPSPVPDDSPEAAARPKVRLGRDISLMMQALNSLHSPEEKIAALCKKYADLLEQHKIKEKQLRVAYRKQTQYTKDREQMQTELNKALLAKSKMESLARELNKNNKLLKEESYNNSLKMEKEREQVSARFQAATEEITGKINSIADRNTSLHEENKQLGARIVKHVEETAAREKTIKALLEHRDLKEQILSLELEKVKEERDASLEQQKALTEESVKSKALYEAFVKQEKDMKAQIQYYSEKFEDFQSTLDKSNKIFSSFRTEMDRMSKKIKELEKGTAMWKKKWEENEVTVKTVVQEKLEQHQLVKQLESKLTRLTNLSRALQAERNALSKKLEVYEKDNTSATQKPERESSNYKTSPATDSLNPEAQIMNGEVKPDDKIEISADVPQSETIEASSLSSRDHPHTPEKKDEMPSSKVDSAAESSMSNSVLSSKSESVSKDVTAPSEDLNEIESVADCSSEDHCESAEAEEEKEEEEKEESSEKQSDSHIASNDQ